jgi:hypothetical protein
MDTDEENVGGEEHAIEVGYDDELRCFRVALPDLSTFEEGGIEDHDGEHQAKSSMRLKLNFSINGQNNILVSQTNSTIFLFELKKAN